MFVHDGPLFEVRTSREDGGKSKCAPHTLFKFASVGSSYSNFTNSLGCKGWYVSQLSGSDDSFCTINAIGAETTHRSLLLLSASARFLLILF